ncbi:MAG TPA: cache domain-containing protein [Candidatus Limnocylindria bacterium]|nr:cache domain-containing protein [Candidatus Limnocylindria bacterium]
MRAPIAARATDVGITVEKSGLARAWPILGALLILGLAPTVLVNYTALQGTRDRLTDLAAANLRSRSISTAAAIDSYIQTRRRDIIVVSQLPDVIAYAQNLGDPTQRDLARAALAGAATATPAYESIAVLSLDGTIMAASIQTDEGSNLRFRDYFQNARAGIAYVSDPSFSVITNKPALFFSAPVKTSEGVLVGVVRSRVNLTPIWDLVEGDLGSVGLGAHSFLVDDYGIRLAVSETKGNRDKAESLIYKPIAPIERETALRLAADKRFGQMSAQQLTIDPLPELKTVIDGMSRSGAVGFRFDLGGVEQRGVATKLESKPWFYVLAMPPASYTSVLAGASAGVIGGLGLAAVLAVLLTILIVRSTAEPARETGR